ncbi:MAG: acyltransferase, partial [Betaproteobacteria bacterium]
MSDLAESDHTEMRHRSDIDGLRAVAVLAVVAFHASKRISGGFVGVDIFFVISGFLISSIILRDLKLGTFNFIDFYVRRIRRIFPALILVLLTCWVLGWYILGPKAYAYLGEHMIAGAGFVSNILLWSESGFFDPAAGSKPLLHLWSLGIEEQFYLVWPVFLVLAWKGKQKVYVWIMALLFSSFVVNIWGIYNYPIATFYLPFSRFWELLLGALLAYINFNHSKLLQFSQDLIVISWHRVVLSLGDIASLAGLLLILTGIFFVSEANSFPGWWALLPTIGAFLLIAAGPKSAINQALLSNRWMVSIGLISYPLYLWHWPLLTFGRMTSIGADHTRLTTLLMVLLSILLSYMTCYLLEKPLRFGFKKHGRFVASGLMIAIAMLATLGVVTNFEGGWSNRYP